MIRVPLSFYIKVVVNGDTTFTDILILCVITLTLTDWDRLWTEMKMNIAKWTLFPEEANLRTQCWALASTCKWCVYIICVRKKNEKVWNEVEEVCTKWKVTHT